MRAVAFQVIFFVYMFSLSAFLVDELFFTHFTINPVNLSGNPINTVDLVNDGSGAIRQLSNTTLNAANANGTIIDRVGGFAQTGYYSIWTLLQLLAGTYFFNVLALLGLPSAFVLVLHLLFPILVAFNVIYFLIARY